MGVGGGGGSNTSTTYDISYMTHIAVPLQCYIAPGVLLRRYYSDGIR